MIAVVDHPAVAQRIDAALAETGATLDVIIDIDPGIARTGVASAEAAVALAKTIAASPNLAYRGVQFYCGSQQHIESYADRRAAIEGIGLTFEDGLALEALNGRPTQATAWAGAARFAGGEGRGGAGSGV